MAGCLKKKSQLTGFLVVRMNQVTSIETVRRHQDDAWASLLTAKNVPLLTQNLISWGDNDNNLSASLLKFYKRTPTPASPFHKLLHN